jgi:SAM-dependent methyltransferase
MKRKSVKSPTAEALLELSRSYQPAAVYAAAADLELFDALAVRPLSAKSLAQKLGCDLRGLTILLDALVALQLLSKDGGSYSLPSGLVPFLTADGSHSILAMAQHQANCLRNWAQLAQVVKTGRPAGKIPSVRGKEGDQEAFIGAMHNISDPVADEVIAAIQPRDCRQVLDIGGASGTWTLAFLRACPRSRATLFDLPHVMPIAHRRLKSAGLLHRVRLVPGDFMCDPLPGGADLAWVSAIIHQNSRSQNRQLFANVFQALIPGGRIAIRDIVMEETRTGPVAGALFAVNMLVATEGGGTFTFAELSEDLATAGFVNAAVQREDEAMNAIVVAEKPA